MPYHLKPNPERTIDGVTLKVMDPVRGDFLPENGRTVPKTAYWIRRLRKGEVVEYEPQSEKPAEETEAEETEAEETEAEETAIEEPAKETPKTKKKAKPLAAEKTPEHGVE